MPTTLRLSPADVHLLVAAIDRLLAARADRCTSWATIGCKVCCKSDPKRRLSADLAVCPQCAASMAALAERLRGAGQRERERKRAQRQRASQESPKDPEAPRPETGAEFVDRAQSVIEPRSDDEILASIAEIETR